MLCGRSVIISHFLLWLWRDYFVTWCNLIYSWSIIVVFQGLCHHRKNNDGRSVYLSRKVDTKNIYFLICFSKVDMKDIFWEITFSKIDTGNNFYQISFLKVDTIISCLEKPVFASGVGCLIVSLLTNWRHHGDMVRDTVRYIIQW